MKAEHLRWSKGGPSYRERLSLQFLQARAGLDGAALPFPTARSRPS